MPQQTPLVSLSQVGKHYPEGKGTVRALGGVSFAVYPGEFLALCGPSGSGKTTTLNLIGALDRPDEGKVTVAGHDLGALSAKGLTLLRRQTLGFIFQAFNLIPVMTAVENAEFTLGLQKQPRAARRARATAALAAVGLAGLEHRYPSQLSGGQQQRVAIARALAPQPALILADEPTANLDTKNALALLSLMEDLNRNLGVTFIFSTHDTRIIERASRVIFMQDGCITGEQRRAGEP